MWKQKLLKQKFNTMYLWQVLIWIKNLIRLGVGGGGRFWEITWFSGGVEGGSVVANRVWSVELTTNEMFVCWGGGGGGGSEESISEYYRALGELGKFYWHTTKFFQPF